MKINTAVKVTNLNADYVDGIDASTQLTRVMRVPFTLAAGASTAPISLPANLPVHVMGTGFAGGQYLGQVTIIRDSAGGKLWWIDAQSYNGEVTTKGVSSVPGQYIVTIDSILTVRVNGATAIQVLNSGPATHSGEITLVW